MSFLSLSMTVASLFNKSHKRKEFRSLGSHSRLTYLVINNGIAYFTLKHHYEEFAQGWWEVEVGVVTDL